MNLLFSRSFIAIAVPVSLQSLIQASLNVVDQLMVGQLGGYGMATVGVGGKLFFIMLILLQGIAGGVSVFIAQYLGDKNPAGIQMTMRAGWLASLLLVIPCVTLSLFFHYEIAHLFTDHDNARPAIARFIQLSSPGIIALSITLLLSAQLRCRGHASVPLVTGGISMVLNTVLNYGLIFGHFNLPEMGTDGAAIATSLSRCIEAGIIIIYSWRARLSFGIFGKIPLIKNAFLIKFSKVILPIALADVVWVLGDTASTVIYSHHGIDSLAAVLTSMPIQSIVFALLTGYTSACAITMGKALGNNSLAKADAWVTTFIGGALGLGLVLGLIIALSAEYYLRLYPIPPETRQLALYVNYFFAAFIWLKFANIVMEEGVLRAGGDTFSTFMINSVCMWCIGLPVAFYAAFYWQIGVHWLFLLFFTEELVKLVLQYWRIKKKVWLASLTT